MFLNGGFKMAKKTGKSKQKGTDVKKSANNLRRKGVQYWFDKYVNARKGLSRKGRNTLEFYRQAILKGIELATWKDGLDKWKLFEEVKESFSYELALKGMEYYFEKKPCKNQVIFGAKKLTYKRKPSWYDSLFRQFENIQTLPRPFVFELNEEGELIDIGFKESEWVPFINPPDPRKMNPEEYLIAVSDYCEVMELPEKVGSTKPNKHAKVHEKILSIQLFDGFEVLPGCGNNLGIPKRTVAIRKFKAKRLAQNEIAKGDPELAEKQQRFNDKKKKEPKIKKSNFKERKALYRVPYYEEPRLIRHWKVIKGGNEQTADTHTRATIVPKAEIIIDDCAA